mgnify:CR=1 FL=1
MKDIKIKSIHQDIDKEKEQVNQILIDETTKYGFSVRVENINSQEEVAIYTLNKSTLSDYIPILENFSFDIESEFYYILEQKKLKIYCRKYTINYDNNMDMSNKRKNIKAVLEYVLGKQIPNTKLNSLSMLAGLSPLEIGVLHTVQTYANQLLLDITNSAITKALIKYSSIAKLFVEYFDMKFNPDYKNNKKIVSEIIEKIVDKIKDVQDITEDKILNLFLDILIAITRTNFYIVDDLFVNNALSIKIDVTKLSLHLKGVQPRIEIFVYNNAFVGTHMRRTKVSRGGLRWSDREIDYRNEIKSLMQAQRSKNSIIIPEGAKGGFYINESQVSAERFIEIYSIFINALLDVVDNYIEGKIVKNKNVISYDDEDPYFVVAADKGTSNMSDVANNISIERSYWLGDAFASGGSKGFNHKSMGITAKGSIKSVERFFIEKGVDFYDKEIRVVGIGSPKGDVFGNGIQLSKNFALVAAVGQSYIFIDPTPDIEKTYMERERLFKNVLNWNDFDKSLLSKGGGVFKKSDKNISVSPEMKKLLDIKKDIINGIELTKAVLTAKVDLLFNGGVGTYVRGEDENDAQIGDKPNELTRVNAGELKTFAVCEGGNLGFTQKARVEFSKKGGKISADSIDNSAGVHTSDYEVNIKIILNALVKKGKISEDERLDVLHKLEADVENIVLETNYKQSLSLLLDELRSIKDLDLFKKTTLVLEENVENFVAKQYEIPSLDKFYFSLTYNATVARPLLSVLLSFSKIFLKTRILSDKELLNSELANEFLLNYYPKSFSALYAEEILQHPLKDDIIATCIANEIINAQGSTFIADYKKLGNEKFLLKIKSFIVLNNIISANTIRDELYSEDTKIDTKVQYKLFIELEDTLAFLTKWVVKHGKDSILIFEREHEYKTATSLFIENSNEDTLPITQNEYLNKFFTMIEYICMLTTIIQVKEDVKQNFTEIANLFVSTTKELNILELNRYIHITEAHSVWDKRLKSGLIKETLEIISEIIDGIMHFKRTNETIHDAYITYKNINEHKFSKFNNDYKLLENSTSINLVNLTVVINSLNQISK